MPELPEVETVARVLQQYDWANYPLQNIEVIWEKVLEPADLSVFTRNFLGNTIQSITRRGKYIVMEWSNRFYLAFHLRMSGRILVLQNPLELQKHQHLIFHFKGGLQIRFYDPRKFGRCYWIEDVEKFFEKLGIEPFDPLFSPTLLAEFLTRQGRAIKVVLLDQTIIAGLGNIYVDESLWHAQIHPLQPASTLSFEQIEKLHWAILLVLSKAIEGRGTSLGRGKSNFHDPLGEYGDNQNELLVYRQTGLPCFRCGTSIFRFRVAQRGTHICPVCQVLREIK